MSPWPAYVTSAGASRSPVRSVGSRMIPVTRTVPAGTLGGSTVPLIACSIWSGRYPAIRMTEPTCACSSCAADSLSITSSARDWTAYRPAKMIARACGGREIIASVITESWPTAGAGCPSMDTGMTSISAPRWV
jgi:hypothetical protein